MSGGDEEDSSSDGDDDLEEDIKELKVGEGGKTFNRPVQHFSKTKTYEKNECIVTGSCSRAKRLEGRGRT